MNANRMTIEEFRATRREVPDVNAEFGAECCFDAEGDPAVRRGYVYEGGYIEIQDDGQLFLILGNWDWICDVSELPFLEERLYDWAHPDPQQPVASLSTQP